MTPESAIATRIRAALAEHLKRDVSKVQLQDDLRKDLGLDSLAMIELLFKIEEAFDLEIPNDDLSQITTVGDVVAYVEKRVGATGTPAPAAAAAAPVKAAPVKAAPVEAAPVKAAAPRPASRAVGAKPARASRPAATKAAPAKKKASRRA